FTSCLSSRIRPTLQERAPAGSLSLPTSISNRHKQTCIRAGRPARVHVSSLRSELYGKEASLAPVATTAQRYGAACTDGVVSVFNGTSNASKSLQPPIERSAPSSNSDVVLTWPRHPSIRCPAAPPPAPSVAPVVCSVLSVTTSQDCTPVKR